MTASAPQEPVTELLVRWKGGDARALDALIPILYGELHRIASGCLRGERAAHTLQTTALLNEAYVRLVGQTPGEIDNRVHFLRVAAHVMRQILVDHARAQRAAKRDGGIRVELDESLLPELTTDVDLLALDEALTELGRLDPAQCQIVELRFFGGLSIEETAATTGSSPATVKREWATARAWLSRALEQ
jgi:RNA polymerase sigma factor (TIGR02999 family)